ncbi:MAG: Na+/H+ antiporter NhaA [Actinomycetota bacterium]
MSWPRSPANELLGLDGRLRVPWSRSGRAVARRVVQPLQSFLEAEASSAVLLVAAAAIALVWANSPWRASYEDLWSTTIGIRVGELGISGDLRQWVNEGLMSLFFLVVGLEVKREVLTGELRDRRAALLPVVAATGGMVVPALLYLAVTAGTPAAQGWGIAMPTDLAVTIAVLALAMPAAPPGLRIFLLTLAIADDIGSVAVVAVAYSGDIAWGWLLVAAALGLSIIGLQRIHVRATAVYVAIGVGVWLAVREAGVSPTIAGVALGLLTPAVPFQRPRAVSEEAHRVADATLDFPATPDADAPQWLWLASLSREAVSPLARVEATLHPWTSLVVVPLFALANAGVALGADALDGGVERRLALAIVLARVIGKPVGIALATAAAVRSGLARRPSGSTWRQVVGVAVAAGAPFTVALFVADLALPPRLLAAAKLGVLVAAVVSGVAGFVLLRSSRGAPASRGADRPGGAESPGHGE